LFLRKLALSVNRLDFWNLEEELNPYELAVLYQAQSIEPTGEDRADLRAAMSALVNAQGQSAKSLGTEQVRNIIEMLTNYLGLREPETISGDEAARRFGV
jgi:hypothetical protein